jgi:hypothetical protein
VAVEITVAAVPAPAQTVVWEVERQPVLVVMLVVMLREVEEEHHQPEELEETAIRLLPQRLAVHTLVAMALMVEALQAVVEPMAVPLLVDLEEMTQLDGVAAAAVVQDTMAAVVAAVERRVTAEAAAAAAVLPIPFLVLRILSIFQEPGSMQPIMQTLIIRAVLV